MKYNILTIEVNKVIINYLSKYKNYIISNKHDFQDLVLIDYSKLNKYHGNFHNVIVISEKKLSLIQELNLRKKGVIYIFYLDRGLDILDCMIKNSLYMSYLINYDQMTKVYNRALFFPVLKQRINYYKKDNKNKFILVSIDLNNLKKINDCKGHLIGDKVILKIIDIIKENIRSEDKIFRLGGDEFAILMNNIKSKNINIILNRIANFINNNIYLIGMLGFKVNISIGATFVNSRDNHLSIYKRADEAMYTSKNKKINFVIR